MLTAAQIKLNGYKALLADHCELVDLVVELLARVEQLEYLMSAEIMAEYAQDVEG